MGKMTYFFSLFRISVAQPPTRMSMVMGTRESPNFGKVKLKKFLKNNWTLEDAEQMDVNIDWDVLHLSISEKPGLRWWRAS